MFCYQAKIVLKQYKTEEFFESMRLLSPKIRKQKNCMGYTVCRDLEAEDTFIVIGEWKTRQAMEKHFQTQNFEVLLGAARVLGEKFEINIAEIVETESFELARKHIRSQ